MNSTPPVTRRDFVKASALTTLSAGALLSAFPAHAMLRPTNKKMKVGLIGCGGRGTGAAFNSLEAHPSTRIVALADLFPDRVENCLRELNDSEDFAGRVEVGERKFTGFDCYNQLLAQKDIDLVILATPPGFRPIHFEAAVNAGKHVFMEKPVAVDPPGVRKVIAAAEAAKARKLSVVAGTQRRHEPCYLEAMKLLHDGQIGEIVSARCAWNQWGLWVHERQPNETDMEWQVRNWLYFCWTSGDHICEQHIHNLDVGQLGHGRAPAPRPTDGRPPGPHRRQIRAHLRPLRH
jgi:myo-inositol 2-dehydrogenase/D-chiro-inositol 1-dehydrogenase